MEAVKDENTVLLGKESLGAFEALKRALVEHISKPPAPAAAVSEADEIAKLAALRDRGVLTEEEFSAKKRQLLGI